MRDYLGRFYALAAEVVLQFEGVIDEVHGDGLVIYFGHLLTHEDEPVRAVRCALELQRRFAAFHDDDIHGMPVRIGLHRGQYAIGSSGGSDSLPTTAVGTASYIAARLQALAPVGGVVLSSSMLRLVQQSFHYESMGIHRLKGLEQPQEVFNVYRELTARQLSSRSYATLIGRDHELNRICEVWAVTQAGSGQLLLVTGEAGIGKTSLVQAFRDSIGSTEALVLQVSCALAKSHASFDPFIRLIKSQFCPDRRLAMPSLHDYFVHLDSVGLSPAFVVTLLENITQPGSDHRSMQYPQPVSSGIGLNRLDAIAYLIETLCFLALHQPVIVVLEDLHWADPSSLDLVDEWVDRMSSVPVLVVATCRTSPRKTWTVRPGVFLMELTRLDRVQSEKLILEVAKKKLLPLEFQDLIIAKSRGIPLFIRELALMMTESDPPILVESEHTWLAIRPMAIDDIPSAVEDAIVARLDQLQHGLTILQLAAVIGDPFHLNDLSRLSDQLGLSIAHSIQEAIEHGILHPDSLDSSVLHFSHALVWQTLCQMIPSKMRKQYHRLISTMLAAQLDLSDRNSCQMYAHHLYHSGEYLESLGYWTRSASLALSDQSIAEASHLFSWALTSIDRCDKKLDLSREKILILQQRAPILMAIEGWASPTVGNSCRQLLDLYSVHKEGSNPFWIEYGMWAHLFVSGDLSGANNRALRLKESASEAFDPCMFLAAQNALSYTHCYRGEFDQSIEEAERGLDGLSEAYDLGVASHFHLLPSVPIHAALAKSLWMQGRITEAWAALDNARSWARQLNHIPSIATSISTQLDVSCWEQNWDSVASYSAELITFSRKYGLSIWRTFAEMMAAKARLEFDPSSQRVDDFLRWLGLFRQTGTAFELPSTTALACCALLVQGNPDAALEMSSHAMGVSRRLEIGLMFPELLRVQSLIYQVMGSPEQAMQSLLEAGMLGEQQHAFTLLQRVQMDVQQLGRSAT